MFSDPSFRVSSQMKKTAVEEREILGIRTSTIEEKCQAFETVVIYGSTLQGRYAPRVSK
jgi:importin-5